jgi:hypothetical protein
VPDQILIAVVPELTLYGLWCRKGRFPEFLKTLENRNCRPSIPLALVVFAEMVARKNP